MQVRTIAVLGAGLMGRGIAYAAALGGFDTRLFDSSSEALAKGVADVTAILEKGVATGKVAGDASDRSR